MAFVEVDSFLLTFKHLWHAGVEAKLNIESKDGKATVSLTAEVGCLPPPINSKKKRNQAYIRRQEKRKAERQEAEEAPARESFSDVIVDNQRKEAEKVSFGETEEVSGETDAEEAKFRCELCNFTSKLENELTIHLARKHAKFSEIEVDESCCKVADDVDDNESDKDDAVKAENVENFDADKYPRRNWYICCTDGCIGQGEMLENGKVYSKPDCPCCGDDCKVHLFSTIGSTAVEYEPP